MKINVIYSIGSFSRPNARRGLLYFLYLAVLLPGTSTLCYGQADRGFLIAPLAGVNFSQLDGDGLSGFDKIGLRAGLSISRDISSKRSIALALLYDQRGSSTGIISRAGSQFITLNYISLPLSISFHSWWHDDLQRHKIRVKASVITARLVQTKSSHIDFDNATDRFKKWDIGLGIGVAYAIGARGSIHLNLERSLLKVYNIPNSTSAGLQSYLVNVGYGYTLSRG